MAKKTTKSKDNKRCRSCSLDCTIVRGVAAEKVSDSKKGDFIDRTFGKEQPRYTPENCPKKGR